MSVQDLGSIGEAIAAIAVIISLLYLAHQIRDNTKTLRATSKKDIFMWWSEWCREISTNPHAVLHERSLDPSSTWSEFSYEEQVIIGYLCRAVVFRFEAEYSLYESGLLESQVWDEHRSFCHSLVSIPTWAEWWKDEQVRSLYSKSFVDDINKAPIRAVMGPIPYDQLVDSDGAS